MNQQHTLRAWPGATCWLFVIALIGCGGEIRGGAGTNGSNDFEGGASGGNADDLNNPGAVGGNQDVEPASDVGTGIFELCAGSEELPGPRILRLLTKQEYANTLRDLLYLDLPDVSALPGEASVRGYVNNAYSQAVTSRHVDAYADLGEDLAQLALERSRDRLITCDLTSSVCREQFVTDFGLRAFRRPLSDDELARYNALFSPDLTQDDQDEGARLVIRAMLISPSFLYRSEVGEDRGDGTFQLSQYELASALSYLYWGSMPDDTLFDAAKRGELATPEQLQAQALRMLGDSRAADQLFAFSLQWLGTDRLLTAFKDPQIFSEFSDGVREAMLEEQRRLFQDVVLTNEGPLDALYAPGYTYVNQELANYYDLPGASQEFAQVSTAGTVRGGVLGLGAVYAAHAHSNSASPIKRGVFVRDRLLCQDLPPPPANLDTTPPGLDPTLTTRERFRQHTDDAACSGCHQFIDDVGFGLEGFDGAGRWREVENGIPVDSSGELLGLEGLSTGTQDAFNGPNELAELVRTSATGKECFALQYYRFARGYVERMSDACSLALLKARFEGPQSSLKSLLVALPQLRSFSVRANP